MAEPDNSVKSLTFWRNWYDAAKQYPDDLRLAFYDAVLAYAFDGVEPSPSTGDVCDAIRFSAVSMCRATIEISRTRKQSGSKAKANRKQTRSKREAKPKQNGANPKQEQEQVQVQEQEQYANSSTTARGAESSSPSREIFVEGCTLAGIPRDFAERLFTDLEAVRFTDADGKPISNWRRYAKTTFNKTERGETAAAKGPAKSTKDGCTSDWGVS